MAKTINDKRRLYIQVLGTDPAREVLADLRSFCFGTKTTFASCPYEMARNEGRREVFLQIMNLLKVDFEDFYEYDPEDYT